MSLAWAKHFPRNQEFLNLAVAIGSYVDSYVTMSALHTLARKGGSTVSSTTTQEELYLKDRRFIH